MRREHRYGRQFPRTSVLPRLIRLVLLLVVVMVVIVRARDPAAWRWLGRDGQEDAPAVERVQPQPARPGEEARPAPSALQATGPTDEDLEEAEFVKEAFGAVADRTTGTADVEMPAYQRLVQWSLRQSFARLQQRAQGKVLYTQLVNAPEEYRGKLVRLDLVLRRILRWDLKMYESGQARGKGAQPDQVVQVYEAWGVSPDSGAHLYSVVLVDPPMGMPLGDGIEVDARFAGYFFKVQKYQDGLHRTNLAPLLIGRIDWQPPEMAGFQPTDWYLVFGLAGVLVLVAVISLAGMMFGRRRHAPAASAAGAGGASMSAEQWLDQAERGELADGNPSEGAPDTSIEHPETDGRGKGEDSPRPPYP